MWEWGFLSNDKEITFALTLGGLHMMSIVTASYIPWSEVLCFVHFDHTELWRNMDQTVQILYLLFSRKCSCLVLGWGVDGGWTRVCVVVVVGGGGGSPWTPGARHTIMPSPLILWLLPTPDPHGSRCFCAVFRDVAAPDEATYKSSDIDTQQQPSHPCPTQVCVCFTELQQKTPSTLSSLSGE